MRSRAIRAYTREQISFDEHEETDGVSDLLGPARPSCGHVRDAR